MVGDTDRDVLIRVFAGALVVAAGATLVAESSFAGETFLVFTGLTAVYTGLRISEGLEIREVAWRAEFFRKRSLGLLAGMVAVAEGLATSAALESAAVIPLLRSAAFIFGGFIVIHLSYESDKS
ncbi:MAG: hypothetical protein ABEI58_00105 [Candidatus Nanohaloarchaea archaeon]